MKLRFKNQKFQNDAVESIVDLFKGKEEMRSTFEISQDSHFCSIGTGLIIGNTMPISDEKLNENMHAVQKRNNLALSDIENGMRSFCIEMETGTGKTYVYTKTVFELNKRYGFTKFIVAVPSVAVREGVYKSLQTTAEHFQNQYDNAPFHFFIYNSAKLSEIMQFATGGNIEIMIINIDAFRKSENIINQPHDKLNGETAMSYIQNTNPVVIIDEPQSVDNTPKAKEAISSLKPLCVFRYSATHKESMNLLYRLTPVDAYQMGLVKQICVLSSSVASNFNKPYIKLLSVASDSGFRARLEIDVENKDGIVSRKSVTVKPNDDLFVISGNRELYEGYSVIGIDCTPGNEAVEFSNTECVKSDKTIGGADENIIKEAQIKLTIQTHLDKELKYTEKGIKVLSLFFIDEVKKYRAADGEKGSYANMFEKCYNELINLPKYAELKAKFPTDANAVHNGYFSQDKKGAFKNTMGDTIADYDTYNTIMKDKEWLLSFDCPLRFIFSHSALKEGWDNPNVFQVCTLIEQKSTFTCRQKVGRGLRLCVNQDGERIEDKNINVLHVTANESFSEFAETLQKEIETETGVKFGVLQISSFSGIKYTDTVAEQTRVSEAEAIKIIGALQKQGVIDQDGTRNAECKTDNVEIKDENASTRYILTSVLKNKKKITVKDITQQAVTQEKTVEKTISYDSARELMKHFEDKGYISKHGEITDAMKTALLSGTLDLPKKFAAVREQIESAVTNANSKLPVRNASSEVNVRSKKQTLLPSKFAEAKNKAKQNTALRVQINTEKLVEDCVKELKAAEPIPKARLVTKIADINIQNPGVTYTECKEHAEKSEDAYSSLPYILGIISEEMFIKRATVARIIRESGRGGDFLNNPRAFLERCSDIIKKNMKTAMCRER